MHAGTLMDTFRNVKLGKSTPVLLRYVKNTRLLTHVVSVCQGCVVLRLGDLGFRKLCHLGFIKVMRAAVLKIL